MLMFDDDEFFLDAQFLAAFELLDDDLDLCSDVSSSDIEPVVEFKSSGSRKRSNSCSDSDSETSFPQRKSRKSSNTLPEVAPMKYANYLVSAINEHDSERLTECLKQICTSDAEVKLQVYNVKDFQKGKSAPTNHFGEFQTANLNLYDFISMQKSMNEIVPDGCMELTSSKCCYESSGTSVYISAFQMKGTIISQDSRIATGDRTGNLSRLIAPEAETLKMSALSKYSKPFVSEGSMIMYRNVVGKITAIEFYYEFSQ